MPRQKKTETKKTKKALSDREKFLENVGKYFGETRKSIIHADHKNITIEKFPTGSLKLDIYLKGGYAKGKFTEMFGWEGTGKAQPLFAKILTPYGWKTMGDLEVGSVISTPDGDFSTVIGVYPQGVQDIYRITFDDKSSTTATLDHLWFVNSRRAKFGEILTTKELIDLKLINKKGKRKFKIPTTFPVNYEQKETLPINPYLLGLLLGDGCFRKSLSISTADNEILKAIKRILKQKYSNIILSKKYNKYDYRFKNKILKKDKKIKLIKELEDLGLMGKLSYDKFIPEIYLRATIDERRELLQGLMDSDGTISNGALSFSTSSKNLSKDFKDLCCGLGLRCNVSNRLTKYTKSIGQRVDGQPSYRVNMLMGTLMFNPFKLKRKANKFNYKKSLFSDRYIEDITFIGKGECQCIAIGHPDKLYITDEYIVTHNTTACIHAVAQHQKKYPDEKILWVDLEGVYDDAYMTHLGVNTDPEKFFVADPDSSEEAYVLILQFIATFPGGVVVVDSVPTMLPEKERESDIGDAKMALAARANSEGVKKVLPASKKNGTTVFWINQYRSSIGTQQKKKLTTGGNVFRYFSRTRLEFASGASKKREDALEIYVHLEKSNYGYHKKKFTTEMIDGEGWDYVGEVIDLAVEAKFLKRKGAWYSHKGTNIAQGAEKLRVFFDDNPEFYQEIEKKVREYFIDGVEFEEDEFEEDLEEKEVE